MKKKHHSAPKKTLWYLSLGRLTKIHVAWGVLCAILAATLAAWSSPNERLTPGVGQLLSAMIVLLFVITLVWIRVFFKWRKGLPPKDTQTRKRSWVWLVVFIIWSSTAVLGLTAANIGRDLFDTYVAKAESSDGKRIGFIYESGFLGCSYYVWERRPWSLVIRKVKSIPTGKSECTAKVCFHWDDALKQFSIICK
ncbi:hypothetical protein KKF84_04985 [Myxococcota bacterium]|nr:hypothetical protein [Myxococcota bacterium]MBU1534651.1 hypothetical protein [Myxococcota bacterium]